MLVVGEEAAEEWSKLLPENMSQWMRPGGWSLRLTVTPAMIPHCSGETGVSERWPRYFYKNRTYSRRSGNSVWDLITSNLVVEEAVLGSKAVDVGEGHFGEKNKIHQIDAKGEGPRPRIVEHCHAQVLGNDRR